MPSVPTATEDYDVGDNGDFISFCDPFRYLGTHITPDLDESFDELLQASFMVKKAIFFDKRIDLRTCKQFHMVLYGNAILPGL
jgi:hypothetical protein